MEGVKLPCFLEEAQIPSLPKSAYYIPNFLSLAEEEFILKKINAAPKPVWRHLSHRRLQTYPSSLTQQNTLLAAPLPVWLVDPVIPRFKSFKVYHAELDNHIFSSSPHKSPNHVLINEYTPDQGILPHEDGGAYYPVVATVSLGSSIVLDIYDKKLDVNGKRQDVPRWRILQEPRSALIMTEDIYKTYLHGISETNIDRNLNLESISNWALLGCKEDYELGVKERKIRVSLTYRDVLKVKNIGKGLGLLGKWSGS